MWIKSKITVVDVVKCDILHRFFSALVFSNFAGVERKSFSFFVAACWGSIPNTQQPRIKPLATETIYKTSKGDALAWSI